MSRSPSTQRGMRHLNPESRKRAKRYVLEKYGPICQWCWQRIELTLGPEDPMKFSLDHTIPVAKGGTNDFDNFQPMHHLCNQEKKDRI